MQFLAHHQMLKAKLDFVVLYKCNHQSVRPLGSLEVGVATATYPRSHHPCVVSLLRQDKHKQCHCQ